MGATLGWLDHDPHERERIARILALFKEKGTRDELGLGGIRDSIADQLFPGTSTIQTRLRYMLFIPWVYQQLELDRTPSAEVARRARRIEGSLIQPLLNTENFGVLGVRARGDLKRLPSSVYWAGLASWGIRQFDGSIEHYHRAFDRLHVRRSGAQRRDDGDAFDPPKPTWDPGLPEPPDGFPQTLSFGLLREEAEYLRDRICVQHPQSLLAWLARDTEHIPEAGAAIWMHPRRDLFPSAHQELLEHAHLFAEVMSGAAVLYNLELARQHQRKELEVEHREHLEQWTGAMTRPPLSGAVREWNLSRFWQLTVGHGHTITAGARHFVEAWVEITRAASFDAVDAVPARLLVRDRERLLKGARSRFASKRAGDQWSGFAGLGLAEYRWPTARTLLLDLASGLQRPAQS